MPFDWFTKIGSSPTVADLVRQKKYKKALDQLRMEFQKGNRSLELRLQYADVLAKAGDRDKAVPVLLGLASELDAAGRHDQALDALRQADVLEPGRADVAARQKVLAARASKREAAVDDASKSADDASKATERHEATPEAQVAPAGPPPSPEAPPPTATVAEAPPAIPACDDAAENDAVLLFASAMAPPNFAAPEPEPETELAVAVEAEPEIPCELAPMDASPADAALDAALGAALAEAEASAPPDEWTALVDEAPPDVQGAPAAREPGEGDADALLRYIRVLASRFPASAQDGPEPSELAGALLGGLSDDELRALLPGLTRLDFGPGQAVVREGERSGGIFILARGRAKVLVQGEHSRPFEVAELEEGSFFGEISLLARPRSATVIAAGPCEVLAVAPEALEALAETRPRVRQIVEGALIERTNSAEVAAVRSVPPMDEAIPAQALGVLDAHFGTKVKDPKMRLRLAELLARTGNYVDVVPVLVGIAEEMQTAGQRARALAILQKIEFIHHQGPKEVGIAPLTRAPRGRGRHEGPGDAVLAYVTTGHPAPSAEAAAHFRTWLQELMEEARDAGATDVSDAFFLEAEDPDLGRTADSDPRARIESGARA